MSWRGLNQGKRSVLLNLSEPEGRALAQRLALTADIVIDNFAPGAMQRFGLDQASLSAINPRIITVSLTGYGEDGPESRFMSYGPSQEPLAGLSALSGYRYGRAGRPRPLLRRPERGYSCSLRRAGRALASRSQRRRAARRGIVAGVIDQRHSRGDHRADDERLSAAAGRRAIAG
jgi:hypothetical protein